MMIAEGSGAGMLDNLNYWLVWLAHYWLGLTGAELTDYQPQGNDRPLPCVTRLPVRMVMKFLNYLF